MSHTFFGFFDPSLYSFLLTYLMALHKLNSRIKRQTDWTYVKWRTEIKAPCRQGSYALQLWTDSNLVYEDLHVKLSRSTSVIVKRHLDSAFSLEWIYCFYFTFCNSVFLIVYYIWLHLNSDKSFLLHNSNHPHMWRCNWVHTSKMLLCTHVDSMAIINPRPEGYGSCFVSFCHLELRSLLRHN